MSNQPLKSPSHYKKQLQLHSDLTSWIAMQRAEVCDIIKARSNKLLIIVGPCSIHDIKAAMEYALKLHDLQKKLPHLKVVMRTYFEKPRTRHGWRGLIADPYLNESYNVPYGLELARTFLLNLAKIQMPVAIEFLNPIYMNYIEDLASVGMIGARTTSSWIHRSMSSYLQMPIGFKNTTSGCIQSPIDAMLVASKPQHCTNINEEGQAATFYSSGNPNTFLTLRGAHSGPNYDEKNVNKALFLLKKEKLTPHLLIDCAHGNSRGPKEQVKTFLQLLKQIKGKQKSIIGIMLESFLSKGSTTFKEKKFGTSITDACINFESTKRLLIQANEIIYQAQLIHTKADV